MLSFVSDESRGLAVAAVGVPTCGDLGRSGLLLREFLFCQRRSVPSAKGCLRILLGISQRALEVHLAEAMTAKNRMLAAGSIIDSRKVRCLDSASCTAVHGTAAQILAAMLLRWPSASPSLRRRNRPGTHGDELHHSSFPPCC